MTVNTPDDHEMLIQALMDPGRWPSGGVNRRRIDTHISTVVLAGDTAYKIKKPLDLGFLNFLDLAARRDACREELRLNRRLAPQIYRDVCAVSGTLERPEINGPGEALDWAVRMVRFDPDAILSARPEALTSALISELAQRVATFHAGIETCPDGQAFGEADSVLTPMIENVAAITEHAAVSGDRLDRLTRWITGRHRMLMPDLSSRKREGFVRECHGDLHLGNVALIEDLPVVFDAIEFNPALRWIDTINDIAFLTMDLQQRGRADLAHQFLDGYLQISGDYAGLRLLRFYEVYRAMVRAKIAAIRGTQSDLGLTEQEAVKQDLEAYLSLAERLVRPSAPAIIVMVGVSGSGKSTVAGRVLDWLPGIRLRSDVERKRLLGLEAAQDASEHGAYAEGLTEQTYARLAMLAESAVAAGFVALVDATFLQGGQRRVFEQLAQKLGVPYVILDCDAPLAVLEARILARRNEASNVSDADLSVLHAQRESRDPLSPREQSRSIAVRPDRPLTRARLDAMLPD